MVSSQRHAHNAGVTWRLPSLCFLTHPHPTHPHTDQARLACVAADARAATAAGGAWLPALATAATRAVTQPLVLAGAAMAPTLNAAARRDAGAVEGLLLWREPGLAPRVGDVVALTAPPADAVVAPPPLEAQGAILIRRVGALGGQTLVTDDPADGEVAVPPGCVWVEADNAALPPSAARDSRSFGPVPTSSLLGRIVYSAASSTDHGPVVDGVSAATAADAAAVLAAEPVDVDRLVTW